MNQPKVVLAVVVRPKGVAYDLLELSVEGRPVHETVQVRTSDVAVVVDEDLVSPEMAVRCVVQPSAQGQNIVAAVYAWSTDRIDDPNTAADERWQEVEKKVAGELITLKGNFDPRPKVV